MRTNYLVTGGAGFLGSAFVRRLVEAGHRVRVLDNLSRGSWHRLEGLTHAVELIEADMRDADAVLKATEGVGCVCHFAGINGTEWFYKHPGLVLEVGVKGIVHVLDACRAHGVRELMLVSSSEVYQTPPVVPTPEDVPLSIPDPQNPRYSYAGAKMISELMALHCCGRASMERVTIVRPHNVYGPDMGWDHVLPQFITRMQALARDPRDPVPFPIQGQGTQTRSFVFIEDFIDGLMRVLERGTHVGIYHIGTTEELTIEQIAHLVGEYFGRHVRVIPGEAAPGSPTRRCPDIRKLAALGYAPKYPFRQGLSMTAKWYVEHAGQQPALELA